MKTIQDRREVTKMTQYSKEQIDLLCQGIGLVKGESYESGLLVAAYIYYGLKSPQIIVNVEEGDYQGSNYGVLYDSTGWIPNSSRKRFFYFNFGWGSCSGCDLLEGGGILEVVESFHNSLVPIPTDKISVTQYLKNEMNNGYDKSAQAEVVEEWEKWRKQNKFDEFGTAEWLK